MGYTIGEFSEILGVTADTLRLYEKKGIIQPLKNRHNNYRYFNDLDARKVLMSRWYRSLEISLQDLAGLVNNPSIDAIADKIEETRVELEEKVRLNNLLLQKVTEIQRDLERVKSSLYKFQVKKLPGIYRLRQTDQNTLLNNPALKEIVSSWMNHFPFTFRSFRIDKNTFFTDEHIICTWGLAIFQDEFNDFELKTNETTEYIPPRTYLSTVIPTVADEQYLEKAFIKYVKDILTENHYTVAGDIFGKLIVTEQVGSEQKSYVEFNVPISL